MKLKNLFKDEQASGGTFVFAVLVLTFIGVMLVWIPLIDAIIPMQQYAIQTDNALPAGQKDPMLPFMIIIIDYFPLWVLMGLSFAGLAKAQKRDDGDY